MGKNKLARWNELGSFPNVIQPETAEVAVKDHPVKGKWRNSIFNNQNPVVLELGCGKGEYTVGLGTLFPHNNYIGVDIKGARMWRGAKTSNEMNMNNVAFLRTRIEFIGSFFCENEVDEIWITFPDPHPGAKNSGKRLTSLPFLLRYSHFLKNNSIIHLKTDNVELYRFSLSVIKKYNLELLFSTDNLYNTSEETFSDNIMSIKTQYEKQFLLRGMKITYISFRLDKEKISYNEEKTTAEQ